MSKKLGLSKRSSKYGELVIILSIVAFSFFLWDTFFIYPIKLFVVMWHEISHGLAAIATGGRVAAIEFSLELGGKCSTEGGIPLIVASSGYLGSLLIGTALFNTSYDKKASIWLCTGLSILLLLFMANYVGNYFSGIVSLFFSALLFISPRYLPAFIHNYLCRILGLVSALYVVIDIKQDILTDSYIRNDAHVIAEITGISSGFWGILWLLISIIVTASLIIHAYRKG